MKRKIFGAIAAICLLLTMWGVQYLTPQAVGELYYAYLGSSLTIYSTDADKHFTMYYKSSYFNLASTSGSYPIRFLPEGSSTAPLTVEDTKVTVRSADTLQANIISGGGSNITFIDDIGSEVKYAVGKDTTKGIRVYDSDKDTIIINPVGVDLTDNDARGLYAILYEDDGTRLFSVDTSGILFIDSIVEIEDYPIFGDGISAGLDTFSNSGASADTVVISGALATDLYQITWASDPGAPADWYVTAKADTLILNTGSAVTSTPSYYWFRYKKN